MKRLIKAFTLVEIMIVVAIIGLLIAIALPNFLVARKRSQMRSCVANLRQIDGAISQLMTEGAQTQNLAVADLIPTYVKTMPQCKAGGSYSIVNNTNATCSYSDSDYPHSL